MNIKSINGFTLLEAILVVAIVSVVVAAVSPLFRTVVEGRDKQDRQIEVMQIGRIAVDDMVRNIKTATEFITISASTLEFDDWEGTTIEYDLSGTVLEKDGSTLAEPIDSLTFTYYDSDGSTTSDVAEVRTVKISMAVSDSEAKIADMTFENVVTIRKDPAASISVAINEINYNSPLGGKNEKKNEWIEIYNFGDDAVDVSGWTIEGDTISANGGSTVIPSGGYGIITSLNTSTQVYSNYSVDAGAIKLMVSDTAIGNGLSDNSETLDLLDSGGGAVDTVTYDDAWGGDGDGDTLERIDPETSPSDSGNWEASSDTATYTAGTTNTTS